MTFEFSVEPTNESSFVLDDGTTVRTLWGHVYRGGLPRAVYYFRWNESRPEPVEVVISLGEFGDGVSPDARRCAAMLARRHEGRFSFMLIDAFESSFAEQEFLGSKCAASEVRGTELAREVFALVDSVLADDERVGALRARIEGVPEGSRA